MESIDAWEQNPNPSSSHPFQPQQINKHILLGKQ